jgi:muconolactone delta-isomerase
MEFLVEFDLHVPDGTPDPEVNERVTAEAAASAELGREGRLVRLWRPPLAPGERKGVGLYRADTEAQLDGLLRALPLTGWMHTTVTPLERIRMTQARMPTGLPPRPGPPPDRTPTSVRGNGCRRASCRLPS